MIKKTLIYLAASIIFLCAFTPALQEEAPTFDPFASGSFYTDTEPTPTVNPGYNTFRDDVEMVLIPEGPFVMGSDDEDALLNARPAHEVSLRSFWIDRYEVTNKQYARCVEMRYCTEPKDLSSATREKYYTDPDYADHPVIHVDYYQAAAYCAWAGKRLPTEAEWEKAARGEDGLTYPWGNGLPAEIPAQVGHFQEGDTVPVDAFPKGVSPYGVYNMEGNVWEWTADQYDEYYYSNSPASDPQAFVGGNDYVIRGFSWSYPFSHLEIYTRNYSYILNHSYDLGFRCASNPLTSN